MSTTIPLLPDELARRDGPGAELRCRVEPMRVRIELINLHTNDGHDLLAVLDCSVRAAESHGDQRMLAEVLLAERDVVRREDVSRYFSRQARAGVETFVAARNARDLTNGDGRQLLLEAFRRNVDASAFACGLIVLPPYAIEVESGSLHRQTLEQIQRDRAEARAAEQVTHLRRSGELLKEFQSLREQSASSSIAPGQILQQIAPADRGSTLEALLLAASQNQQPATLWAVAGPYLVKVDPPAESSSLDLIPLPSSLGPLRSVQPATLDDKPLLLVGAQAGVILIDPNAPRAQPQFFTGPGGESQLGFNRAVLDESTRSIFATHKDYGLVAWEMDSGAMTLAHSQFAGARNVQLTAPGTVAFSVGAIVHVTSRAASTSRVLESADSSPVIALLRDTSRLDVVRESGLIEIFDGSTQQKLDEQRRAAGITAAATLLWLGSVRLLFSRDDGAIECAGIDDQLVTQYISVHHGYKMLAASAGLVAAVSSDRQRLILWHSWDGRKPFADMHLTSQTRHRIADIDFS